MDNPKHIDEQSIWRLSQVKEKSPECIQHLHCVICGCDIQEKSFENNGCDEGCYPPMMNKEDWENFKKSNQIQIS
jgi:predicted nucleic acid-binding Zn ribbon protein